MIIRGTTPTREFGLPFSTELVELGFVIISQNETAIIEKAFTDCEVSGNTVIAHFTQEETLRLSEKKLAEIRIVLKTKSGERFESDPISESVGATSKNEVI